MFRIIRNAAIFIINYDTGATQIAECSIYQELYSFLAEQQVNGNTFHSVHKIQEDGSLSEVEVKTNKDFIRLVNEYQSQYELVLREEICLEEDKFWKLSLIPQKKEDCNLLYEFYTGWSKNLTDLRKAALNWIRNHETPGLKITLIEAK